MRAGSLLTAGRGSGVALVHRGLSLLALLTLFQGLPGALRSEAVGRTYLAVGVGLLYAALLAAAAGVLTVRRARTLRVLDVVVLGLGVVRIALLTAVSVGPSSRTYTDDEGSLVTEAARALASWHHVYGAHWPGFRDLFHVDPTPMMNGGFADSFGYPPLSALLTAPLLHVVPGWVPVAGLLSVGAVVLGGVLVFRLLPEPLAPAATALAFGISWTLGYARNGYPVFLTLPLLAVVVARWSRVGSGQPWRRRGDGEAAAAAVAGPTASGRVSGWAAGRLSGADRVAGACLGLAASAHQLAWFLTPFVLVGVAAVRLADTPARAVAALLVRWCGWAVGAFAVVNLPFVALDGPAAWGRGILTVLTQHATPQGLGPVDISYYLTGGTGQLGAYSLAAAAAMAATLAALALWPARLAPALAALPWPALFLSTRSTETYFMLLTPLWLLGAACLDVPAVAGARGAAHVAAVAVRRWGGARGGRPGDERPGGGRLGGGRPGGEPQRGGVRAGLGARWRTAAAVGALALPSVVLLGVAVGSPSPLGVRVASVTTGRHGVGVQEIRARLENRGGRALRPAFATSADAWLDMGWRITSGPRVLAGHSVGNYVLRRDSWRVFRANPDGGTYLRVLTDDPETLTNVRLP